MAFRDKDLKLQLKKLERIKYTWDTVEYNEAVRKAKRMSTHQILAWMEEAVLGIGRAIDDYGKLGEEVSLLELRRAISQFQALTEELIAKHDAEKNS